MDGHIEFGDLVAFAWMDRVTEEDMSMILRVNSHLARCEECGLKLEQLQRARRDAERLRAERQNRLRMSGTMDEINRRIIPLFRNESEQKTTLKNERIQDEDSLKGT